MGDSLENHSRRAVSIRPVSHIAIPAELFQSAAIFQVLSAASSFGDFGKLSGAQLGHNFSGAFGAGFDWNGAGSASERAIPFALALVKI
jgi:hypothetical protein